ncbi:MAG TPA: sugar transferase [Candidatus Acidoferrum sp.]|nr:sugar transferase [Candidatus Acidoferrum sp.]
MKEQQAFAFDPIFLFSLGAGLGQTPSRPEFARTASGVGEGIPKHPLDGGQGPTRRPRLSGGTWARLAYAAIDLTFICIDGAIAVGIRFAPHMVRHLMRYGNIGLSPKFPVSAYGAFLLLYAALIVLFCQWQDLYRTPRSRTATNETLRVSKAVALATLLLVAFVFLSGYQEVSRAVVLGAGLLDIVALSWWRFWKRKFVIRRLTQGIGTRNALIVGAGSVGQALAESLERNKLLGYRFRGFLDTDHSTDHRLKGRIEDLARVGQAEFVDDVFITLPAEREVVKQVAIEARNHRWNVKVVPDLYDGLGWQAPLRRIGDFPVMELHWEPIPALGLFAKKAFDIALAALLLVALSPLLLLITALIQLDSTGPVLYRSQRVGRKGQIFTCYKFRTMVANADALKKKLIHLNERRGPFFKIRNDPRITSIGKFLRKYSLDELPQLWNVLKGDMSLVGPRPHTIDDYSQYQVDQLRRLEVRPGLTGLWQVTAREDPSFETTMRLDRYYIDHWDFWLDFKLLLRTFPAVLRGGGA